MIEVGERTLILRSGDLVPIAAARRASVASSHRLRIAYGACTIAKHTLTTELWVDNQILWLAVVGAFFTTMRSHPTRRAAWYNDHAIPHLHEQTGPIQRVR